MEYRKKDSSTKESDLRLPKDQLLPILDTIVNCIGGANPDIRKNLYVCLFNYLQYTQAPQPEANGDEFSQEPLFDQDQVALTEGNLFAINRTGNKLFEIICRDTLNSNEPLKAFAFAALSASLTLFENVGNHSLLDFLIKSNLLNHFVLTLREDDIHVQNMLEENPDSLVWLHTFEAKLSLLTKISESKVGARQLKNFGIFQVLSDCKFLGIRPDDDTSMDVDSFFPSASQRYHQLLCDVLRLCTSISILLENETANSRELMHFIQAHQEILAFSLQDRQQVASTNSLERLKLVTGLFTLAVQFPQEKLGFDLFHKIDALMLNLLAKYMPSKQDAKLKTKTVPDTPVAKLTVFQILKNIISYLKFRMDTSPEANFVLFAPSLIGMKQEADTQTKVLGRGRYPNLSVLVNLLDSLVELLHKNLEEQRNNASALSKIEDTPANDLDQLLISTQKKTPDADMPLSQRQAFAAFVLRETRAKQMQSGALFVYLIENALFLLWKHLSLFLSSEVRGDEKLPSPIDEQEKLKLKEDSKAIHPILNKIRLPFSGDRLRDLKQNEAFIGLLEGNLRELTK